MSDKKIAIDLTANLIYLRLQIAQDYWSPVRFTLSKTTQNKSLKFKKGQKQQLIEVWEIL